MRLSHYQRWVLRLYDRHRGGPLPVIELFRQGLPTYALAACSFGGCALMAYLTGWPSVALVLLGAFLGTLYREAGMLRELQRMWPVYREIIAWDRVERLLAGDEPAESSLDQGAARDRQRD